MLLETFVFILGLTTIRASSAKFFRRDYAYNEVYDAFYKLHWADSSKSWQEAFITCDVEGAKLFYPETLEEWKVAANLTGSLADIEEIYVGVHDEFGQGDFISVEGRFVPELSKALNTTSEKGREPKCAVMSVRTGSFNAGSCKQKMPFICKRIDNESCPTIDSAYIYSKRTNKCFKIHKSPSTWQDAHHRCYMEGGILITSTENFESVLHGLIKEDQFYFIGIRRILPQSSFYSLLGSNYELSQGADGKENCKVVKINGSPNRASYPYPCPANKFEIRSYNCNTTLPYICEMQVTFLR